MRPAERDDTAPVVRDVDHRPGEFERAVTEAELVDAVGQPVDLIGPFAE